MQFGFDVIMKLLNYSIPMGDFDFKLIYIFLFGFLILIYRSVVSRG